MYKKEDDKIKRIISGILTFVFVLFSSLFFYNYRIAVVDILCGYAVKNLPIYKVGREDKVIAISFDCAWGNEYTQKILDELDFYDVKCTFFMVSFWAEKFKDDVKRIAEKGHEIGTHSKTHSYMSKLSQAEIDEELNYSIRVIEEISNKKVNLFRPPYGDYNDKLLDRANSLGLYTIQWDVDSLDWKDLSAKEISLRVISKVTSGSIILCHNNGLHTAESLPLIFSDLKAKGYKFVKISELIYKDGYKIAHDGTQVKISD